MFVHFVAAGSRRFPFAGRGAAGHATTGEYVSGGMRIIGQHSPITMPAHEAWIGGMQYW